MTTSTKARRAELVEALEAVAGGVLVTDDPRQAIPPCILVHPVPSRTYTEELEGAVVSLSWQVIALAPGGSFDAASSDLLDELQAIVEDGLETVTRLVSARVASFTTRTEQPPSLAIITTTED